MTEEKRFEDRMREAADAVEWAVNGSDAEFSKAIQGMHPTLLASLLRATLRAVRAKVNLRQQVSNRPVDLADVANIDPRLGGMPHRKTFVNEDGEKLYEERIMGHVQAIEDAVGAARINREVKAEIIGNVARVSNAVATLVFDLIAERNRRLLPVEAAFRTDVPLV